MGWIGHHVWVRDRLVTDFRSSQEGKFPEARDRHSGRVLEQIAAHLDDNRPTGSQSNEGPGGYTDLQQ